MMVKVKELLRVSILTEDKMKRNYDLQTSGFYWLCQRFKYIFFLKTDCVHVVPRSSNALRQLRGHVCKSPWGTVLETSFPEWKKIFSGCVWVLLYDSFVTLSWLLPLLASFDSTDKLSSFGEDLKPPSLMRKSPSLESVLKSPCSLGSRTALFSFSRGHCRLRCDYSVWIKNNKLWPYPLLLVMATGQNTQVQHTHKRVP